MLGTRTPQLEPGDQLCASLECAEVGNVFFAHSGEDVRLGAEEHVADDRRDDARRERQVDALSLPSSDEEGTAGKGGKSRARKPRKKKETAEGE